MMADGTAPADAILTYEDALRSASSPAIADRLRDRIGPLVHIFRTTLEINSGSWSGFLALYAQARRVDQRRILTAAATHLIALGVAAGKAEEAALYSLGGAFPSLVLEGAAEQRFCCDLALRLAAAPALPPLLVELMVRPLTLALRTVLSLGAPHTVILALEAAGALLKFVSDPASAFPPFPPPAEIWDFPESVTYLRRLERDRRIVLAIAGDAEARQYYFGALDQLLQEANTEGTVQDTEAQILGRIELLRVLPAFVRLHTGEGQ